MQRYLIRKSDESVFIWTEALSKRGDLEEVFAESAALALAGTPLPKTQSVTLAELESMKKVDLMVFAKVRLGLELDPTLKKADMLDMVKPVVFSFGAEDVGDVPSTADINKPRGKLP